MLEVADRGPGVPRGAARAASSSASPAAAATRARSGGSGLGLAIVKAVADAHGGRVELLEAEGGGARFVVTLPAGDAAQPVRSDAAATRVRLPRSLNSPDSPRRIS